MRIAYGKYFYTTHQKLCTVVYALTNDNSQQAQSVKISHLF